MMIQTTFFDYQQLDSETRINLKQRAERICERTRKTAVDFWESGRDFHEAQQELALRGYGCFIQWAESETGYKKSSVYRMIDFHKNIEFPNLGNTSVAISAFYLLSSPSTPEEARQEAMDRAQNGEIITPGKAKEIVEDHKKAKQEKEEADGYQPTSQPVTLFEEFESEQEQVIETEKEPEPPKQVSPKPKPKPELYTLQAWERLSDPEKQEILRNPPQTKAKFNTQAEQDEALKEEDIAGVGNIEWALWSWSPVTGCLHNCPYCYARDVAQRFYKAELPDDPFQPVLRPNRLHAPRNTKVPDLSRVSNPIRQMGLKNVFVCSMADLFGKWVPSEWIEAVLEQVRANPQWNFLMLTKFPIRMAEFEYPANAWLGTSVDHQWAVDRAEKAFRKLRANGYKGVAWLSCEPMMERLTFSSLDMFNWVVIGGASKSSQTPEFKPPREWVMHLWGQADQADCKVYEKTNLLERRREYPW